MSFGLAALRFGFARLLGLLHAVARVKWVSFLQPLQRVSLCLARSPSASMPCTDQFCAHILLMPKPADNVFAAVACTVRAWLSLDLLPFLYNASNDDACRFMNTPLC